MFRANRTGRLAITIGLLAGTWYAGSGCVAFNVGKPEVFRHTEIVREAASKPTRAVVEDARVQLRQMQGEAEVSIRADIREEYDWKKIGRTTTVRKQKRLAFGLFPGVAEMVWMPEGALSSGMTVSRVSCDWTPQYKAYYRNTKPKLGYYARDQLFVLLYCCGLMQVMETARALFVTPFENFGCGGHDFVDQEHYRLDVPEGGLLRGDASRSPKLQALSKFPKDSRKRIGVLTCFDEGPVGWFPASSHLALLGFHKYPAVFVELPKDGEEVEVERGVKTVRRKMEIAGPYEAELSIPGLGYSDRRKVPAGKYSTVFSLPNVARDGRYEANVTIREAPGETPGVATGMSRGAARKLLGQASRFELELRMPERSHWIGTGNAPRGDGGVGPSSNANHRYEILAIKPSRDGHYSVRVKITDAMRRREAIRDVEADVRRRIREDFAGRHPGVRVDEIHERLEIVEAGRSGNVWEFEGWAFSAHALSEGWHYDAETRRGEVRMLLSESLPATQAIQWARENIGAIVADKGIALTAGRGPSMDAVFRCLAERIENGILVIEFEVIE